MSYASFIFVKLDVAGHSSIYVTRSGEKHFWKKPYPSMKFFIPAFSTRIIGTIIAVFGIFMAPVSWQDIGYIWIYATVWFILNDSIKVWTYKLLRRGGILKMIQQLKNERSSFHINYRNHAGLFL